MDTMDSATLISSLTTEDYIIIVAGLAVVAMLLYVVKGSCGSDSRRKPAASVSRAPERPKLPYTFLTRQELKQFNGEDETKPIFVAIRSRIYDVSSRPDMYGQGGGYNLFAGIEASRALAKSSFEKSDLENPDLSDLSFMEKDTLLHWEQVFTKYEMVGEVVADEKEKETKSREYEAKKATSAAQQKTA